jgi:hypothetical protein
MSEDARGTMRDVSHTAPEGLDVTRVWRRGHAAEEPVPSLPDSSPPAGDD